METFLWKSGRKYLVENIQWKLISKKYLVEWGRVDCWGRVDTGDTGHWRGRYLQFYLFEILKFGPNRFRLSPWIGKVFRQGREKSTKCFLSTL